MVLNTTSGPVARPAHTLNTSRAVEEDMTYEDEESEILSVLPGTGWQAVAEGELVPLVAFVAMDDGRLYGVAVGEDGRIDLVENDVEKNPGFTGYKQATNDREQ